MIQFQGKKLIIPALNEDFALRIPSRTEYEDTFHSSVKKKMFQLQSFETKNIIVDQLVSWMI